jgi:putative SOS response-associated peptidase YedK
LYAKRRKATVASWGTRADGQPIGFAGLWDRWQQDNSETNETFTIVTTGPRAEFHNRMPLVLEPEIWDLWLKGEPDAAAELMKPANDDALVGRPVSKAVGNVKNNTPDLLA